MAHRFWGERPFTDVRCYPERLEIPQHWLKPQRVFVNSISDLFHPAVSDDFLFQVLCAMMKGRAANHTFLVLSKRAARMHNFFNSWYEDKGWMRYLGKDYAITPDRWPLPNLVLGVSVENQKAAYERIHLLEDTPAKRRFLSIEPLLSPVDLTGKLVVDLPIKIWNQQGQWVDTGQTRRIRRIHKVIVGCESGPGHRPMNLDWVRGVRDVCIATNTQFFFKQAFIDGKLVKMPELDGVVWNQF
jgi:protein gp37